MSAGDNTNLIREALRQRLLEKANVIMSIARGGNGNAAHEGRYTAELLTEAAEALADLAADLAATKAEKMSLLRQRAVLHGRAEKAESSLAAKTEALERIERMAGAAGTGETPGLPLAEIARAALRSAGGGSDET